MWLVGVLDVVSMLLFGEIWIIMWLLFLFWFKKFKVLFIEI